MTALPEIPTTAFLERLQTAAARRAEAGLTRRLRPRGADPQVLDLAGNDYLGLATDARVIAAAVEAARFWGAGASASRLVTGTLDLHAELESELAAFCRQPAALVFSSGYLANLGVVTALAGPDTLVVSDAHVHASLVDACRLSRARVQVVPHNDVTTVDRVLATRAEPHALVLAESVYSVLGDAAPLPALADTARRHAAVLVVDEAHGIGVCGLRGRGLVEAAGLAGQADVVVTLTLSKALGSQGGAVLGVPEVIDHLVNAARPFIYDTGLNPPAAAAALEAVRIVDSEPDRVRAVRDCAAALGAAARVGSPAGAVLSVPVPSPELAVAAAAALSEDGVRVGCFRPPSVPDGVSRLRFTASARLVGDDLARAVAAVAAAVHSATGPA